MMYSGKWGLFEGGGGGGYVSHIVSSIDTKTKSCEPNNR